MILIQLQLLMIHQHQQFLNLRFLQIHSWNLQEPMLKYICLNIAVTELLKLKPLHRIWWDLFATVPKVWWAFVLAQAMLFKPLLCSLVVVAYIFLWVPPCGFGVIQTGQRKAETQDEKEIERWERDWKIQWNVMLVRRSTIRPFSMARYTHR